MILRYIIFGVVLCLSVFLFGETRLAIDGKTAGFIVLGAKPTRSAQLAAYELQYHMKKLSGARLEILNGRMPQAGAVILVGESELTGKLKKFDFQEYLVKAEDGKIILAGCDEADYGKVNYASDSTYPGFWEKTGTLYAVYDFLELLGIRWYLPTDLGISFIPRKDISVKNFMRLRKPTMEMRNMFYLNIPKDLCGDTVDVPDCGALNSRDLRLWYHRLRHGGKEVVINHSMYTFYNRYWPAKKEWFAKGYGETSRPAQLCYTNQEVIRQVSQDARDYFDGKKNAAQVVSNVSSSYKSDVFPVFPMDNRSFCKCPECSKYTVKHPVTRGKNQFSNDYSSEYLFSFVNAIARNLKKTHPGKMIGAGAYAGFAYPPRTVKLEDNIMVMMCLHTGLIYNKSITENDDDILNAWVEAYPAMKKYVWMYWCFPYLEGIQKQFRIFPSFMGGKVGEIFRKYRRAGVQGMFHEPAYLPHSRHSVLFNQLEEAIIWSLAWDESRDQNRLYNDFFKLYYGPAENEMKAWYEYAEKIYTTPRNYKHQTDEIAWKILGTKEVMNKLEKMMNAARKASVAEPYKSRVALFDKGVWQYMKKGKKRGDELDSLKNPTMQQCSVAYLQNSAPGNPLKINWSQASHLSLYGGMRAQNLERKLKVCMAHDGEWLYARVVEEGIVTGKLKSDTVLWLNDEWEFFFGKKRSAPYRQLGIDVNGSYEGIHHEGIVTETWHFPGKVFVNKGDKWWGAFFAVRLKDLLPGGVRPGEMFYGNVIRSAQGKAVGVWIPTFTGYHAPERMGELYLEPKSE